MNEPKNRRTPFIFNHERDSMIERLMTALSDGLRPEADRAASVKIIISIKEEAVLERTIAPSALDEVETFLNGLGTNLENLVEAIGQHRIVDEKVVQNIQEAARAWYFLGSIGD